MYLRAVVHHRGFPDGHIGAFQIPLPAIPQASDLRLTQRHPTNQLFLIMAAAALLISAISLAVLYSAAVEQHQQRLAETVKSQARLIEAIAEFENLDIQIGDRSQILQTTLEKVALAYREFEGFGNSGEFALAKRDGSRIRFLLSQRHGGFEAPEPILFTGHLAEPMRRALEGKSGVMMGLDYRGVEVLAAYEPMAFLELGLVAKIDIDEIREPFIRAGLIAIGLTVVVIFIVSRLFFRVFRPLEETIDQQSETFRILAHTAREGIVIADTSGVIEYVNEAIEKLFGYTRTELIGESVKRLMPEEQAAGHDRYVERYLQTGEGRIIGTGRQLTAKRKDGSRFPIYLSIGDIETPNARLFAGVILDMSEQQQLQREILEIPMSEQRRIGQELHDGLGQQLTGLGLLATSLVNKAGIPEYELAKRLEQGLREAISQVRALSRGLIPVDIDAEGFRSSLQLLVDEVQANSRIAIDLTIHERIIVRDNSTALHLYRIAQEAINNAVKHAAATKIEVSLGQQDGRGCLTIHDNGRGFSADDAAASTGLGLRIMRYRCGLIDAEFNIDSSVDNGTEVRCYFQVEV